MELRVNNYVRTKNGNIRKIVELSNTKFIDDPDCYVDKVLINIEQNKAEDTIYMEKWLFEEEIVKSSPNIIDLIEVGDYVSGMKITNKFIDEETDNIELEFNNGSSYLYPKSWNYESRSKEYKIKSIVTKEQFSQMEYKVNKND